MLSRCGGSLLALTALLPGSLFAQADAGHIQTIVRERIVAPEVVAQRAQDYLLKKGKPLPPVPQSGAEWTAQMARLRKTYLDRIVYDGWPKEWVNAPLKVEEAGEVASGPGYRMKKLRYEIVPGFWTTAILYLPDPLPAKAPAILNVNGHVAAPGKAIDYKQKRCINQARHGIIALNTEWIGCGELFLPENEHWFGAHLDVTGATGVGAFYLAMRKGLDLLWEHPNVDRKRIGMTGLSGGGWQTINLSALDERVAFAVPVAGYTSFLTRVERSADVGDLEQNPANSQTLLDYPTLTAMRAPRPTMLIYNTEDNCCFRAPLVKPHLYDAAKPYFRLFGKENELAYHENADPGTHNYELDNRLASYHFFYRNFGLPDVEAETPVDDQVKTYDELKVGLPADNLTLLTLARKLAGIIRQPGGTRETLTQVVHYREARLHHAWALKNTTNKGIDARPILFDFEGGLLSTGVRIQTIGSQPERATILLNDMGKADAAADIAARLTPAEAVLALDVPFHGEATPTTEWKKRLPQLFDAIGEPLLGIQAAHLVAAAKWLKTGSSVKSVRVETVGMRSQVVALVAAALEPGLFQEVRVKKGIDSLRILLDGPVEYPKAPELFCHGLYRHFDLPDLERLAGPGVVQRAAAQLH